MIVSKVNSKTNEKMYLKMYQGTSSVWTSEKDNAKIFVSREAASKLANLHKATVEK